MSQVTVNNAINLTYPDSYHEMTEEELQRYFSTAENRWGVYDEERHVVLSVFWSKAGFFSFMSDAESFLIPIEARYKRKLINYRRKDASKIKIAKKKGYGFSFEYRVNNANMYQIGELRAIKHKGRYYVFQYIGRRITDDECRADYNAMVESVTLA